MTVIAFAGPSLSPEDRERFPNVEWRPPAEAGDLLRLPPREDLTVCLIDGYFDHRPAVRHKEVLLLLSEGKRVFGASSMGALRAAEMDSFGMIGIGAVYRAYARGSVTGDDEVALIHAGPARGWRPLSVPLVDVRATLCRAVREKVLAKADARGLLSTAAAIHYVDRSWAEVMQACEKRSSSKFEAWLPKGQVEQKRIDALACIEAALSRSEAAIHRPQMVRTVFLNSLAKEYGVDLEGRC